VDLPESKAERERRHIGFRHFGDVAFASLLVPISVDSGHPPGASS
jgi:hypothetical protein